MASFPTLFELVTQHAQNANTMLVSVTLHLGLVTEVCTETATLSTMSQCTWKVVVHITSNHLEKGLVALELQEDFSQFNEVW